MPDPRTTRDHLQIWDRQHQSELSALDVLLTIVHKRDLVLQGRNMLAANVPIWAAHTAEQL